jgi:hypothetical protein
VVIGVLIIAVLAVLFVILIWVRSGQPGNEGESLGDNLPYPDTVFGPSWMKPRPGTRESLDSHEGANWADEELRRERHRNRTRPV